jgi:hypothetical protein
MSNASNEDNLIVDLFIDDSKADAVLKKNQARLESFRQEVIAKNQIAATQTTDVFKRVIGNLSSYQKTQLSFQLNDIATSLASGANPLQVLAQQGGQIVQILQMTKVETQGLAAATGTAAASEAVFATSAKAAAISQAEVAVSSQATAASMTQASGAATIMGASLGNLAGILSAGAIAIFAVYKVTQQIEHVARQRLEIEEKIAGRFGKQIILAGELNKLLAEAATRRADAEFLSTASPEAIQRQRDELIRQRQAFEDQAAELDRRAQRVQSLDTGFRDVAAGGIPIFGKLIPADATKKAVDELSKQADDAEAKAREFNKRILELDQGVVEAKKRRADADVEITRFAERTKFKVAQEAIRRTMDAEKESAEKRKKLIEEGIGKVRELGNSWKAAFEMARGFMGAQNPFSAVLNEAYSRMTALRENTKGLPADLRKAFAEAGQAANSRDWFNTKFTNALSVVDLQNQAQEFRQGFRNDMSDPAQVQRLVDQQLRALGGRGAGSRIGPTGQQIVSNWFDPGDPMLADKFTRGFRDAESVYRQLNGGAAADIDPIKKAVQDQKLIELSRGIDPRNLREDQRSAFSMALESEAKRRIDYETKAQEELVKQRETLVKIEGYLKTLMEKAKDGRLPVDLGDQAITLVEVTTPKLSAGKRSSKSSTKKSTKDAMEP